MADKIEILVDMAHQIFNQHSLHEIIDLDRPVAREVLYKLYGPNPSGDIEGYLDILGELRAIGG